MAEGWQEATKRTVERIQSVFNLERDLEREEKFTLLTLAQQAVHFQLGRQQGQGSATEYWNVYVNTLRTLVAGVSDVDSDDLFDK